MAHNKQAQHGGKHQTADRTEPTDERGRGEPTGPHEPPTKPRGRAAAGAKARTRPTEARGEKETHNIQNKYYIILYKKALLRPIHSAITVLPTKAPEVDIITNELLKFWSIR
jgi:hypothetical protein